MNNLKLFLSFMCLVVVVGCNKPTTYSSFDEYPTFDDAWSEMNYHPQYTEFMVWAPTADSVKLNLYNSGSESDAIATYNMSRVDGGRWRDSVNEDLIGKFYTFLVCINGEWQKPTPGVMAKAVGVNGERAAIIDFKSTNPQGWGEDKRPALSSFADIVIYEMHHRDFSMDVNSGIKNRGKFLALTEEGTVSADGLKTGIDHLKELGVTHVHILPSYDYASVDETKLDTPQYNWGYDPLNYNVPDGSYSTDPYDPSVRISEFKQMVVALHKAGIRVVLDVVYNHTFNTEDSNFERTVPQYFFRQKADGTAANGSGCGNETASERTMVRKYMIESVLHWVKEYHIDGFRFDLMGIHDIETMNQIRAALNNVDPTIFVYGEGWAAEAPAYDADKLAMKVNTHLIPGVAAFSDEFRDGLRGSWQDDSKGAFVVGEAGFEPDVRFGIVAALPHPQLADPKMKSPQAWCEEPTQMISYVSCHDDHCIADRLIHTAPEESRTALFKLAETAVFTSQGVPFIFAGDEIMRDKKGVKNSYKSPDEINTIEWSGKSLNRDAFEYVKGLIAMRKAHPAFRLGSAELVYKHLKFIAVDEPSVVAFRIEGAPNGDTWKDITVVLNARESAAEIDVPKARYQIVAKDGKIDHLKGLGSISTSKLNVAPQSAMIVYAL